jgi:O-antigen ligase
MPMNALTNAASGQERSRFATGAVGEKTGRRRRQRPFVFWLLMAFFVLEYIRPEPIVQLRLQMLCLYLFPVLWLADRKVGRSWSRNLTLQTAFLGICAFSGLFATNTFSAYITTRSLYGNVAIALAITWLLANWRDFTFASWFWVLIMALQAVYAISHGGHGMGASLGDENDLALGLNTAIPFAFVGFRTFPGWRRWGCGALFVLLLAGIVTSLSRGGFIGLVAVILYCVLFGRHPIRNLSIALVGSLVFYLAIPESYKTEVASIKETDSGTAEARRFLWTAAFNMWRENPVLGVGAGNSIWNLGLYQPRLQSGLFSEPEFQDRDWSMTPIHSVFFQLLAETGTIGILLFGAIVWGHFAGLSSLRRRVKRDARASPWLRKNAELYAVALGGSMAGYLASGAFLSVAYYPYPWYFSAFAVALARAVDAQSSRSHPRESPGTPLHRA